MRIETVNLKDSKKSRIIQVNDIIKIDFREGCVLCVKPDKPSEITRIDFDSWDSVFIYAGDLEKEI